MHSPKTLFIFLVDDDLLFQKSMSHFLSGRLKHNLKLRVFVSGEDCLRHMEQKPDLILLDYMLSADANPVLNGIDVLDKIRSVNSGIPVVLISGNPRTETVVEAIKHGAYDFIEKNEDVYFRTEHLLRNALKSTPPPGLAENLAPGLSRKKESAGPFNSSLQAKSRIFFSPFFLPESHPKHAMKSKPKRKAHISLAHGI